MNNDVMVNGSIKEKKEQALELNKVSKTIYKGIKRIFDIILSLFGTVLLVPIIVVVKIVYILNKDYNSIFFTQNRIGKDGKEFKFYKFRTMVPNADEILFNTLAINKALAEEYKLNKKLENDPRITKVGRIMRKTSIDELPQVLNILKGDMSLIGNRPYLPREKEDMGLYYASIVKTKPGLTGYWQVNGRSETSFGERLTLEKYYSCHANLKMDIQIFFKTFKVVLLHKGSK